MLKDTFKKGYIPEVLMKNPATHEMLEKIYLQEIGDNAIDNFFIKSSSGEALRGRLEATINYVVKSISNIVIPGEIGKIVDYGCGTARYTFGIISKLKSQGFPIEKLSVDCIDISEEALGIARSLVEGEKLKNFNFIRKSFLQANYHHTVRVGLMIGVLCGRNAKECVTVLKRVKRHFIKKGSVLIASNVLETMKDQDLEMAFILKDVIGWSLNYKTPAKLKKIFEEAGYEWIECFFDEPLKFHCMGIGIPK